MEPFKRQREVIDLARVATQPIAWLGSVREGKTAGSCLALMHIQRERPGDYGVFSFSATNFNNSIRPSILKIFDYWDEPYVERKANPKFIEWEYGRLLFFTASDAGMEKVLQGATLQGAFTDEILLYPKNVVMQIVGRFTFDNPFWIMTANKDNPYHWIKTGWIDKGKVLVVNSETGENPHVSKDARSWHEELLEGHFKDRMIGNEWSSDMNQVGLPILLKDMRKAQGAMRQFQSFWCDDARYHACVSGWLDGKGMVVTGIEVFDALAALEARLREPCPSIGNWLGDIARQPRGSLVGLMKPDFEVYARSLSRLAYKVDFSPFCKDLFDQVASWSYRAASEHDLGASLTATPPEVLAVAQGVHHMLRSTKPMAMGKPT